MSLHSLYNGRNNITELVQEWIKSGNDDIPDELANLIQQENNGHIIPRASFLERYKGGTLCFHLHLAIKGHVERLRELEAGDWCLVVSHPNARLGLKDSTIGQDEATTSLREMSGSGMQQAMLVSVRQVSQNRKRVTKRILPSRVGLQGINDCQYVRSNAAMDSRRQWLTSLTFGPKVEDWKLRRSAYHPTVLFNQTADEMVEGGSEIMKTISKDNPDALLWFSDNMKFNQNQVLVARLNIEDKFVRLAFKVAGDFICESVQMLLCPVELEVDTIGYYHDKL